MRRRFRGDGGVGTWIASGGLGLASVIDRFPCGSVDPTPCRADAVWAMGPAMAVGLERRF